MKTCDLVIIGGGPAGLAAALGARNQGIKDILIVERDKELGGILNQCIHNGFGLHTFKEELTGPEYAGRYIEQVKDAGIPYVTDSMVLSIQSMSQYKSSRQADKVITMVSRTEGIIQIQAKAVILAMGCRERPRGALNIPGYRPAGIYSAGTAQRLVNMEGYLPGREVVILGSGDIGLIMARRMTLEGAHVKVVAELMPYSGGLKRNIVQCLNDYDIPLKLSHTVVDIHGKERVTGITLAKVDEKGKPIPGTEEEYACDTLLLSCGLIPENELSRELGVKLNPVTSGPVVDESLETNVPGVFACGNVLHVHDLVDFVSEEADRAGTCAARYILQENQSSNPGIDQESQYSDSDIGKASKMNDNNDPVIPLISLGCVRYTVPSAIHLSKIPDKLKVRFRVGKVVKNCAVDVYCNEENSEKRIKTKKRPVVAPGEMEEILLGREELLKYPDLQQLIITVKEG
ncbi:MAG: NAD(P)/FAD-dependent oxidoreductase [Dorea formicigenerans]